jgi:hypothetical protein
VRLGFAIVRVKTHAAANHDGADHLIGEATAILDGLQCRTEASQRIFENHRLQQTESGARFPNARVDGTGDVCGIPLLTSRAAGNRLILIDPTELVVVDNGLDVTVSTQAAVAMDDNPSAGAAQLVSGYQTGTAFLKFVRRLWWALLRADAVAYTTISDLANSPS